ATWLLSWPVRAGLLRSLVSWSRPLHALAGLLAHGGTPWSAMHVELRGRNANGEALQRDWYLLAGSNHGPQIPCLPVIALARRLLRGEITQRGAMPCLGLLSVEDILGAVPGLDLHVKEQEPIRG
ncbi:MAG TPA: hypothetical protein VLI06_08620, partial [Solimonas sp.]|nr:hypothetical protein [Solimonas sp.]